MNNLKHTASRYSPMHFALSLSEHFICEVIVTRVFSKVKYFHFGVKWTASLHYAVSFLIYTKRHLASFFETHRFGLKPRLFVSDLETTSPFKSDATCRKSLLDPLNPIESSCLPKSISKPLHFFLLFSEVSSLPISSNSKSLFFPRPPLFFSKILPILHQKSFSVFQWLHKTLSSNSLESSSKIPHPS